MFKRYGNLLLACVLGVALVIPGRGAGAQLKVVTSILPIADLIRT